MNETLIDQEAWKTLKSMTDADFLAELIEIYLADSPQLMEQIRAGLPSGDIVTVRRAAHSLKSNSASFGANRLAEAARDLEMIARNNTLEGAEAKFALIEEEFALLVPVLLELKDER